MSKKLSNKQKKTESKWTTAKRFLGYLLDGLISVYMLLVIVVMPFYYTAGYGHIGTDKAMFFRKISVNGAKLVVPVLLAYLLMIAGEKGYLGKLWEYCKKKWLQFSLTDKFALLYGVSLILSYLCSNYKDRALWGARGWYMGFLPQIILLVIYFLISRIWKPKQWMFLLFLPVSAVVFLLGILNRFGIHPLEMQNANSMYISTIGNINWYCGYLVSVFFAGYYLLWQSEKAQVSLVDIKAEQKSNQGSIKKRDKKWEKGKIGVLARNVLLVLYVAIGFASLVTQGSQSGLLALAVVLLVMFCLSVKDGRRMQMFWQLTLILSLSCSVMLGIRVLFPGRVTYDDTLMNILTYSAFPVIATIVSLAFLAVTIRYNRNNGYSKSLLNKIYEKIAEIAIVGTVSATLVLIAMIVFNTMWPGSFGKLSELPIFTFNADWGSNRGATWMAGWRCFKEQNILHKLVGVGPDCMSAYLYTDGSASLVQMVSTKFGTNTLTNAHGEWLTVLVNMGVLGCVGFVGMMISAIIRFLKCGLNMESNHVNGEAKTTNGAKASEQNKHSLRAEVILGACGLCLLAYTANNWFSFQQSMSVATIFVILGIGEAYARKH